LPERESLAIDGAESRARTIDSVGSWPTSATVAPGEGGRSGQDLVDATVSQRRLDRGLNALEGLGGDVGRRPRAEQRARQQYVWPTGDAGQPLRRHAELGSAFRGQRALVVRDAGRATGYRGRVADEEELHRTPVPFSGAADAKSSEGRGR
jgi:hypothetical protein